MSRRRDRSIPELSDELELVVRATNDVDSLFACLLVSKAWHAAAKTVIGELSYANILQKRSVLKGELVGGLCISPARAAKFPHALKRRTGGGHYCLYDTKACVRAVMADGGIEGVEKRRATRMVRSSNAKARHTELVASRTTALRTELKKRGCADNMGSFLAENYVSLGGQSPADVAARIARRRYLYECTDFHTEKQKLVDDLVKYSGGYFPGIHSYAASLLDPDYPDPPRWPWA